MKKILLVAIIALSAIGLQAQIKNYDVVASKTYENGTRTAYLEIEAELDHDLAVIITKELESNPDIHKFSFYAEPDFTKLMFTSNISVDEQMVVDLMNEVLFSDYPSDQISERDFRNRGFINNLHVTNFTLDFDVDSDLAADIINVFKESDLIIDVDYFGKSEFRLTSDELVFPQDIENLLLEWEIKIKKEDIK